MQNSLQLTLTFLVTKL